MGTTCQPQASDREAPDRPVIGCHWGSHDDGGAMNDSSKTRSRAARWAGAAGLVAAGAITGGVLAGTIGANAATTTAAATSSSTPSSSSGSATGEAPADRPEHGSAAHESNEKAVTGANATKAQAAAVKVAGSGTAGAVTADMTGSGYEVTVTKSDGSTQEVHLNSAFAVASHLGGHGGHGD
jgi:hypothetical protein